VQIICSTSLLITVGKYGTVLHQPYQYFTLPDKLTLTLNMVSVRVIDRIRARIWARF